MSDFIAPGKEEKKTVTPLPQDTAGKLVMQPLSVEVIWLNVYYKELK
jgi:hypothetical protein